VGWGFFGVFCLVGFMLGSFLFFLSLFSPWKGLEFHGCLEELVYRGALLRILLWFSAYTLLTIYLHTPFLFHLLLMPSQPYKENPV